MIQFVVNAFLEIAPVPLFTRIGLRYIDHCPLPSKDTATFRDWYNSTFPLDRFRIEDATAMTFQAVIKRNNANVRYSESLRQVDGEKWQLVMDFDGFQDNVDAKSYLNVTDSLHELISQEFERSIRKPLYDYMKQPLGG